MDLRTPNVVATPEPVAALERASVGSTVGPGRRSHKIRKWTVLRPAGSYSRRP